MFTKQFLGCVRHRRSPGCPEQCGFTTIDSSLVAVDCVYQPTLFADENLLRDTARQQNGRAGNGLLGSEVNDTPVVNATVRMGEVNTGYCTIVDSVRREKHEYLVLVAQSKPCRS